MFFTPRVNLIASDEGFSIEVLGRTGIEYREGERAMIVDAEVLAPGHGIALFKKSLLVPRLSDFDRLEVKILTV